MEQKEKIKELEAKLLNATAGMEHYKWKWLELDREIIEDFIKQIEKDIKTYPMLSYTPNQVLDMLKELR